jgi:hypothetical protein
MPEKEITSRIVRRSANLYCALANEGNRQKQNTIKKRPDPNQVLPWEPIHSPEIGVKCSLMKVRKASSEAGHHFKCQRLPVGGKRDSMASGGDAGIEEAAQCHRHIAPGSHVGQTDFRIL